MNLATMRTKYFPIVFIGAGILFMGLFFMFYSLVFEAIYDILDQQNTRLLTRVSAGITHSETRLKRESGILHAGRSVRRKVKSLSDDAKQPRLVTALYESVISWSEQVNGTRYRGVMYLDRAQRPIIALDLTDIQTTSSLVNETNFSSEKYLSEILVDAWEGKRMNLGDSWGIVLNDSSNVIRTMYPIAARKKGEVNGYVVIDRPLSSVIDWLPEVDRELIVIDTKNQQIIFDSSTHETSGLDIHSAYPELGISLLEIEAVADDQFKIFTRGGKEYIGSRSVLESPGWTLIITVNTEAYIAKHKIQGLALIISSILFVVIAGGAIYALVIRVRRRTDELIRANEVVSEHNHMLAQELQTAHDMQMRLMPQDAPKLDGFEIEGRCLPATEVGGDFFQYFPLVNQRFAVVLADVTGHGMQAAIPTMVLSGLLDNQMKSHSEPDDLLKQLNDSLYRVLDKRTFICFCVVEIDPILRKVRVSNAGIPYPYIFRAKSGSIDEIALAALPLGIRAETGYSIYEEEMDEGDFLVFCTDGIIEAQNNNDELFGFERTAGCIQRAGMRSLSAKELVDELLVEVDEFTGGSQQMDDQTVVAIKVNYHPCAE
jgi:serine phosphatase RsbU (regulator of sigma subunit)